MSRREQLDELRELLAVNAITADVSHETLVLDVAGDGFLGFAARMRDELGFDLLLDVTAVDWPQRSPRFDVVHHFYSSKRLVRVRTRQRVGIEAPSVASLVPLFGSARYMERECHDMYGIRFEGNSDLRPILLYEGFEGHPLRKDYPKEKEQPLLPPRTEP